LLTLTHSSVLSHTIHSSTLFGFVHSICDVRHLALVILAAACVTPNTSLRSMLSALFPMGSIQQKSETVRKD
jgi:hypothetical protein